MGVTEAIRLVKSKCKVSEKTLYKWKKEFDWDGREAIRSKEIQDKVEKKTNTTIVGNKVRYLNFYHKLLDSLEKKQDVNIRNVNDLQMVIKGCLLLQDEPTENIKSESKQVIVDDPNRRADLSELYERWDAKTDKSSGSSKGG
jgi:hypothetical protein